eukprot:5883271-Amphidinium_carterae.1
MYGDRVSSASRRAYCTKSKSMPKLEPRFVIPKHQQTAQCWQGKTWNIDEHQGSPSGQYHQT